MGICWCNKGRIMTKHTHEFVEEYEGLVGFGLDRVHDEATVIYYLQKFSDDTMIKQLIKRMTDGELEEVFNLVNKMLQNHLSETEYHGLFLKEEDHEH